MTFRKFLQSSFKALVIAAPAVFFLSYYPIISIGATESMNLELSLPLIWLVLFGILSVILIFIEKIKISYKFLLPLLFPLYLTFSILWSPNRLRAILTVGILWLIFIAIFALILLGRFFPKKNFMKSFYISSLVACAWCWLQGILDVSGISREVTLLCQGCTVHAFGFPHPNGFAIEPQFMGNLLLAPAIVSLWQYFKKPNKKQLLLTFIFSSTLFFTFSRGAIFSFALALLVLMVVELIKQKTARPLLFIAIPAVAFVFTLNLQGLFSAWSPTNDTYLTGISKVLNQLSLGVIDINIEKPLVTPSEEKTNEQVEESAPESSVFDGYVEESTAVRMDLSKWGLEIWRQNPKTIFVGTGLGGAGIALYENNKTGSPKEIVQNQFVSILLEAGLVGVSLLVVAIIYFAKLLQASHRSYLIYLTLLIAYSFSLLFFAGLPNAIHIYLLPVFLWQKENKLD